MHTTRDLLEQVKLRHGLQSNGALARTLGITKQAVSNQMHGRFHLGQETALKVAELLDLAPDYVIACTEAERAQTDATRRYWSDLAKRAGALAACVFAVIGASILIPGLTLENGLQISMLGAIPFGPTVYYVKFIIIITAAAALIHSQAQKNN